MITVTCPSCKHVLRIPDQYAGQLGRCKTCGQSITVPKPAPSSDFEPHDFASLNVSPEPSMPPPIPRASSKKEGVDGFLVGGWILFAAGILSVFTGNVVLVLCIMAGSLVFVAVDGNQNGASTGTIVKWCLYCVLLWVVAFPVYMVKRENLEAYTAQESQFSPARVGILLLVILLIFVGMFAVIFNVGSTQRRSNSDSYQTYEVPTYTPRVPVFSAPPPPQITLAKFNSIRTGMTYQQVVQILGKDGTLMSENQIMDIHTAMYSWENPGVLEGNMNAMFQNNSLISKAQFMLK